MLLLLLLLIMFFLPSFFFDEIIKVYYNCMFSYRVCHFFSFCTKKKNWKLYSCWCLLFIFTAVNFVLRLLIYYAVNGQFFFCCFMTTICDFFGLSISCFCFECASTNFVEWSWTCVMLFVTKNNLRLKKFLAKVGQ